MFRYANRILSAFFDLGRDFVYAANFLLTLVDHARCGTPEIPRERIFER